MQEDFIELKVEISCFLNWDEWLSIAEGISPNLASFLQIKQAFFNQTSNENKQNYYDFLLEKVLNTHENLQDLILKLEIILSRSCKQNPIAIFSTKQLLKHYLSLMFEITEATHQSILIDIIRITSQLSDIYQDSHKMTKSINNILQSIEMKESQFISEIRHMATHKDLPSVILTKKSVEYLLVFFLEHYWFKTFKCVKKMKINENTSIFSCKNIDIFKQKVQRFIKNTKECQNNQSCDEIIGEFQKNLQKKRFKCGLFLSEIMREFISLYINITDEGNVNTLKRIIIEIINLSDKKNVGKLIRFPFIKYKILKMISLCSINSNFKDVVENLFKKFYLKNDKNMLFLKKFEEIFPSDLENIEVNYSTEHIKAYFNIS